MRIHLSIVLIAILIFACTKNKDNKVLAQKQPIHKSNLNCDILPFDTLSIDISDMTSPIVWDGVATSIDNSPYFTFFNKNLNGFEFYSIYEDDNSFNIVLDKEGRNSINSFYDFFIQSKDSVYVFHGIGHQKKVSLMNSKGDIYKNWNVNDILPSKYEQYWYSTFSINKVRYNKRTNEFIFYLYKGDISRQETQETFQQVAINLEKNTTRLFGKIPEEFYEKSFYPYFGFGSLLIADKFINFYPSLHTLAIYNSDSLGLLKVLDAKSSYSEKLNIGEDEIGLDPNLKIEKEFLIESDAYLKMITNQEGSLIYRFIKLGKPALLLDGSTRDFYDFNFALQVFDKDFNLILEKDFSDYDPMFFAQSFAIDNTLYISLNNPKNKKFNEEKFQFAVFKIDCN
jgi:hypothetical protein